MARSASFLCVMAVSLASVCRADVTVAPVTVSSPQGSDDRFLLEYIIDQSGLSSRYTSGVTDFDSYTSSTTHRPFDFLRPYIFGATATESNGPQQFTFDLGAEMLVSQISIWNTDSRGAVLSFELLADNDSDFSNGTSAMLIGPTPLVANHPDLDIPIEAQIFAFTPVLTRYIHVNGLSSREPPDFYGLAEVVFGAVVPAPGTGLALGAFVLAASVRRRRG